LDANLILTTMSSWDPVFNVVSTPNTPKVGQPLESTPSPNPAKSVESVKPTISATVIVPTTQAPPSTQPAHSDGVVNAEVPVKWSQLPVSASHRHLIDCRPVLPKLIEINLDAAQPILETDKAIDPNNRYSGFHYDYYSNSAEFRQQYPDYQTRYEQTVKRNEMLSQRAQSNPPTLNKLLDGQIPAGSRYEAGDYEPIGMPIRVAGLGLSPLVMAAHHAFCEHRPLALRPDDLLFPLIQAVGIYLLSLDPTLLREKYFKKSGKIDLTVQRNDLVMGKPYPWENIFEVFAQKIAVELGPEARSGLRGEFSTSGPFQQAAYDVALMNATRSVFNYHLSTLCGIPVVELVGTPEDWIQLGEKMTKISAILGDPAWTQALQEKVVDPLIQAARHRQANQNSSGEEAQHWASFYKYESHSGGYNISGWVKLLFPWQINRGVWQRVPVAAMLDTAHGITTFIPGYATVPVEWQYYDQKLNLRFVAGQVGVAQRKDGYLQPLWGWGVYEVK
jgi:hypothetical protein